MAPEDEYQPFPSVARRNFTQEVLEVPLVVWLLGVPHGVRVLEIGCGQGAALAAIARRRSPSRLAGIDIDARSLIRAEQNLRDRGVACELAVGDARRIPFRDGAFDVVIDFGTCYHIGRAVEAISEIERVLAAGGRFVFETRVSQLMSHPVRSFRRRMAWPWGTELRPDRRRLLWSSRVKG